MNKYIATLICGAICALTPISRASTDAATEYRYYLSSYTADDGRTVEFRISDDRFSQQPVWNALDGSAAPLTPSEALAIGKHWVLGKYPNCHITTIQYFAGAPITDKATSGLPTAKWYYTMDFAIQLDTSKQSSLRYEINYLASKGNLVEKPKIPIRIVAVVLMDGTIVEPTVTKNN